ncbi:AMP-binding protein [Thiohalomonas denitrificans]|uniref:Acyl-[acyl-carrier-protein]-phospholipid O-acyltransferase / long-chain-fatty-acid--[acyl-carrier-protein] ligase n=1 Tax=Thiohalomonas denitrificans TaxID=415747 RepID=A0A1G5QT02_9GAMM|nr:AMP-binding protein [Thiohalomonas denitrificans]SCZ64872.1 acyl-[acyl-carrier-protein]-phospholipid O-acyltransferase / long-chain-fatty-acid--[acyl-carrier-protein] ligase [Thiohalomonas denitrificans]
MEWFKKLLRVVLTTLYKVEVRGLENLERAGPRALIIANHTSFLDAVLLTAFLPGELTFGVNTHIANNRWFKPFFALTRIFPMDPTNPLSVKSLVRYLKGDRRAVIFPEGRITVTGSLMKVYTGPGMVADRADAPVVPVRIEGAQFTPFSRLKGRVRLRWFPKVTLTILEPRRIDPPQTVRGRDRRKAAGKALSDIMTEMVFATSDHDRTLFQSLLDARRVHGGRHHIVEDIQRRPLSYHRLIAGALTLGRRLKADSEPGEHIGLLLPSSNTTVVTFMGLQAYGRVPAMLNYTAGAKGMIAACETARIRTVVTSRRFIEAARLGEVAAMLGEHAQIVYLEDFAAQISAFEKLSGWVGAFFADVLHRRHTSRDPNAPAVILFTSGSEGTPKGVVLSHANLLANRDQLAARVDFSAQDIILNALPLFHSFGLTAGTLLPLFSGMKIFFYPSPLHYRIVPEIAYDVNATVMFGTNTFLAGYARFAHPYDFYSVRYVFAGAEKLAKETRRVWSEKFGVRIFEGYGATETSPVLAANTPMENRPGSVGRFLPGVDYRLEPVPGVEEGGRLYVAGPNIMLGYLLHEAPGKLVPPAGAVGAGWYDTGDIVSIDEEGFVTILGRAKRFAKVGGEMVSLTATEEMVATVWPDAAHAVVALPDPLKGEQLVLLTEHPEAERAPLQRHARSQGIAEITVPKKVLPIKHLPLLGTGKLDYPAIKAAAEAALAESPATVEVLS